MAEGLVWIGHTTRYREGGVRFAQVARTLAADKRAAGHLVRQCAVETKQAFVEELQGLARRGARIRELHFIGHSGMYGVMFGTRDWPEQLSPHEWRQLQIPFSDDGQAFFHACRTARWFAPFFADVFRVPSWGYFWYTAFSTSSRRYARAPESLPHDAPLYVFGCPGLKSHGPLGSLQKHLGLTAPEALQRFVPRPASNDASYDAVAALYDATFQDIRVRHDEWTWLSGRLDALGSRPRVLDLGCGNGALLHALAGRIEAGVGLDASQAMLQYARRRTRSHEHLRFELALEPALPVPDSSVDLVISLLSFRYLDWDPTLAEVRRVLRAGGRLWVVDMVEKPPGLRRLPRVVRDRWRELRRRKHTPGYARALATMVSDPRWQQMLKYNPMRADHELRWYLQSRFPAGRFALLNQGLHASVVAFDSGPIPAQPEAQAHR